MPSTAGLSEIAACPLFPTVNGSVAKNLPAVQETWVQSLGGEDPLEKEMATHSSILAWRIQLQLMGCKELDAAEQLHTYRVQPL